MIIHIELLPLLVLLKRKHIIKRTDISRRIRNGKLARDGEDRDCLKQHIRYESAQKGGSM
jgi:hypothetical protein